jgi:uncharacterized protein (DUF2225 family)
MGKLGFTKTPDASHIYQKPSPPPRKSAQEIKQEDPAAAPENYIFLRKRTCPACGLQFEDAALRVTKCRFTRGDTDLRPYYEPYDPILYDVVICYHCGYAAMHSAFDALTDRQAGVVKSEITPYYKYREYPLVFSVEDGIERYQLALLCAVVKKAKESEKAYLCLKLAWLCRASGETDKETGYLKCALEGFELAFAKESFPIYGMDDVTLTYLCGELSRRIGKKDEALRYIGRVIVSPAASDRLKQRAREVKDLIKG